LSMIGALSIDAYLPALPAIALHFGVSLAAAQQSLTIYLFAFATMTLFYGTLSDSFGRRPVILIALTIYLVSTIGAGCSTSLGWLMLFRLLQGLSAGAGGVVGRAIIGDLFKGPEAERMMSYVSALFGVAPAVAPILGGWLLALSGWRSIFLFIAIFTLVLLLVCLRELRESLPVAQRHAFHFKVIVTNYWHVARHGRFLLQSLGTGLAFSGIMLYVGTAPAFVFNILHLKATDFGWLFIPMIAGMTLGSLTAGRMSHRAAGNTVIHAGFLIMLLAMLANVLYCWLCPIRVPWAVLPVAIGTFGSALASPAMTMRSLAFFPHVRGLAASLQSFVFLILFSIGSGVIGPLLFGSALNIALGAAVGTVLGVVAWTLGTHATAQQEVAETVPA
jgi:DHA1 family bicyclomycin/chloramphenicol resistance-like MFS transporter